MKLILTQSVDKLGQPGDVVEVKDGYGRNYLVPRHFAIAWTRGAEKQIEGIKRSRAAKKAWQTRRQNSARPTRAGSDTAEDR